MSFQRSIYAANNSSNHLPSYPIPGAKPLEDYKPPAEDDIIDSYTTTAVPLSKQPYPVNASYPSLQDRHVPLYPPFGQKPSFQSSWEGQSETHEGGNAVASDYHLTAPNETVKAEKRSFLDTILPDSVACRFYVLTVLLETIIDVTIEADLYLRVNGLSETGDASKKRLPVYLAIFCFAHLFQLGMAIDAVHARNTLQFLFLTIFNALFLVYAVIQIFEIRDSLVTGDSKNGGISDIPVNVLTTIIPIVISIAEVAYIALGWKIWREFGWKVYKRLGADRQVKRMYAQYQIFVGIMKFDVFFFVGFCVQLILLVLQRDWEYYVTLVALPFSVLVLVNGLLAARYENKWMMLSFMMGCGGAMVYFVFKLYRIYQSDDSIEDARRTLTVFAVIAIILLIATVAVAFLVLRNFGGGLKYHMAKKPGRSGSLHRNGTKFQHRHNQSYPMSNNPNRMSID